MGGTHLHPDFELTQRHEIVSEAKIVTHTPATPLPWRTRDTNKHVVWDGTVGVADCFGHNSNTVPTCDQNAAYIVKSANAYPKLIALLSDALEFAEGYEDVTDRSDGTVQANAAMSLCSKLRDALEKAGVKYD